MAYSRSKVTLEAIKGELQELALGKPQAWVMANEKSAYAWAYKVREALHIAKAYPSEYPGLAVAAENYVIEVHFNRVEARRALNTTEFAAQSGEGINQGLELARRAVSTSGKMTVFTIVDSWRKVQPSNDPLHFPQADLTIEELTMLYRWAKAWKPPLMLMVDGPAVTVGPADPHAIQYEWTPAQAPPPPVAILESPRIKREGGEP